MTRLTFALRLLALALLVVSCDSYKGKISKANFEKIQQKMTRQQVEEMLGAGEVVPAQPGMPTGFMGDVGHGFKYIPITEVKWTDGTRKITVTFFGDEVAPDPKAGGLKSRDGF